jgi:plasmid stabilization system protein ParE
VEVVTTPKASKDLEDWLSRIAAKNPQAAESFLDRIRKCIEMIRTHPDSGHKHPRRPNVRKLVEVPIIIHYEIFEEHIEILRFWHSARNPRAIRYR